MKIDLTVTQETARRSAPHPSLIKGADTKIPPIVRGGACAPVLTVREVKPGAYLFRKHDISIRERIGLVKKNTNRICIDFIPILISRSRICIIPRSST